MIYLLKIWIKENQDQSHGQGRQQWLQQIITRCHCIVKPDFLCDADAAEVNKVISGQWVPLIGGAQETINQDGREQCQCMQISTFSCQKAQPQ